MMPFARFAVFSALAVLPASPVLAHTGSRDLAGIAVGFTHPLTGLDHLAAMLLVGVCAAMAGGRAMWTLPVAFVGTMALGALLGASGLVLPFAEIGIALSVVLLGLACVLSYRGSAELSALAVGAMAVPHGYVHALEMPPGNPALYALGFLVATAALHGVGLASCFVAKRLSPAVNTMAVRVAGAVTLGFGSLLLLRAI